MFHPLGNGTVEQDLRGGQEKAIGEEKDKI